MAESGRPKSGLNESGLNESGLNESGLNESGRPESGRKPRADALRNRGRLIDSAKEILGQGGPGASLEAVARHAGVGIGTLYRNFPTREALFQAVYRHEVEQLIALAESLGQALPPMEALRGWLHGAIALVATKRGLVGALSVKPDDSSAAMFAEISLRLRAAVGQLMARAVEAGELRADLTAEELMSTFYSLCYARPLEDGWADHVIKMVDIFVDGARQS